MQYCIFQYFSRRWEYWREQTVCEWLAEDFSGGKKGGPIKPVEPPVDAVAWRLGLGCADPGRDLNRSEKVMNFQVFEYLRKAIVEVAHDAERDAVIGQSPERVPHPGTQPPRAGRVWHCRRVYGRMHEGAKGGGGDGGLLHAAHFTNS